MSQEGTREGGDDRAATGSVNYLTAAEAIIGSAARRVGLSLLLGLHARFARASCPKREEFGHA